MSLVQGSAQKVSGRRRCLIIGVLSFNRPVYLAKTLVSLKRQLQQDDQIYLFQDGAYNTFSDRQKTEERLIDRCVDVFKAVIPQGVVLWSPTNLGIAGNYRRAEEFFFLTRDAVSAVFLEDDLVLSPYYLDTIDQLLRYAEEDEKIGYVSAYGDLWAPLSRQHASLGQLRPMHENWGFGLTKTSWLRQADVRDAYWQIVRGSDYSYRPNQEIVSHYTALGYKNTVTSQDGARWIACAEAGLARITTSTCNASYIGKLGEHFNEALYDLHRFAHSVMFPSPQTIEKPRRSDLDLWIAMERENLTVGFTHSYISQASERCVTSPPDVEAAQSMSILQSIDAEAMNTLYDIAESHLGNASRERDALSSQAVFREAEHSERIETCISTIRSLEARLAAEHDRNVAATQEIASLVIARDQASEKYMSCLADLTSTQALLDVAASNGEHLERLFAQLVAWSVAFHDSTVRSLSWRLTKPLRMIGIGKPKRPLMPAELKSRL